MDDTNYLINIDIKIKKILHQRQINIKSFTYQIGMSEQGYIYAIKKQSLKVSTLLEICDFLNVSPLFFFKDSNDIPEVVAESSINYESKLNVLKQENELLKNALKDKDQIIDLLKTKNG